MGVVEQLPSPMCTAALRYARRGWKVFPCRERDETLTVQTADGPKPKLYKAKSPYTGKGCNDATTDEGRIRAWWRQHPQAMIGLAMGGNKWFALDFDPRVDESTGEIFDLISLKAATEEQIGCELPVSLTSITQSDGVHVIYRQPEGDPIINRGNLPRHVDVRGKGGYIVAPPSVLYREDGSEGRYRWRGGQHDIDPVDAPAALVQALRERKPKAAAAGGALAKQTGAAGGTPASAVR
ncbi:bifunctional DNA primase/polymerase [Sphingomonas sp. SRS2]|uniref:bifunctional DNA primase/polymerase n=1 Tax=Sphingomonas sp. SRS2 TaxID=133190 RepID=UPI0006184A92|nr:bifunctional DNA primase/polymerase [Sphingomonas sp. SRS2]KKC24875.1 hypothetical protein WP12_16740 [Sphingomonas sp. SRS2]